MEPDDTPTPEQLRAARELLAKHDAIGESMEVLAAAGHYNCKISGTTADGHMRFVVEGGAPAPARKGRRR